MPKSNQSPLAEIKFVDMTRQRPPLVSLRMDITLHNDVSEPRWYVLPSNLNLPPGKGVDGGEVFELKGQGRVFLWRFQGTASFQAVHLPGAADVTIRNLPIAYWGSVPDPLELNIGIAAQALIDQQPIEAWLSGVPISDRNAVVDAALAERLASRFTPDRHEVAVAFTDLRETSLRVSLSSNKT